MLLKNPRNWIELGVAAAVFAALSGIVWAMDAPRDLVPAIWMGGVLAVAGTGYWRARKCAPSPRPDARS